MTLFGHDVKQYSFAQLRSLVGIVPQQAVLFTGTIRDNMQWAAPNATDAQIWEALEIAQAADFVRGKPGMLDAPVETAGRNFSGGQRQRLTIARALVPKPKILILDDSASALDFATDAALRKAIKRKNAGYDGLYHLPSARRACSAPTTFWCWMTALWPVMPPCRTAAEM